MVSPVREEAHLYIGDCLDEIAQTGTTTINERGFAHLSAAYDALMETRWNDVKYALPEAVPHNQGKLIIPCLVVVTVRGRKPRVTIAQRRWDKREECWVWSRHLDVIQWRELPEV